VERFGPLLARVAALINGVGADTAGRHEPQAAIDAMFAR
jgi:hypothetical protein